MAGHSATSFAKRVPGRINNEKNTSVRDAYHAGLYDCGVVLLCLLSDDNGRARQDTFCLRDGNCHTDRVAAVGNIPTPASAPNIVIL